MTDGAESELIWGEIVTGNYFSGLGVHPVVGRGFLPDEDRAPGEKPVCVLNYNFWQRRFQGDPNIAGKTIKINDHALTVVGVAPRGFIGTTVIQFRSGCLGTGHDAADHRAGVRKFPGGARQSLDQSLARG